MSIGSMQKCANCKHLSCMHIGEYYHCDNDDANIHPVYRVMHIDEAYTRSCDNGWEYQRPSDEMIEKHHTMEKFIIY